MEGFELISTGAWSIVPPLLALVLALVTKEVYSSLLAGVFSGLIIYEFVLEGPGVSQFVTAFTLLPSRGEGREISAAILQGLPPSTTILSAHISASSTS